MGKHRHIVRAIYPVIDRTGVRVVVAAWPKRGFDVYCDDKNIGYYEKRLPGDGRGYRYRNMHGACGTTNTARQAQDDLIEIYRHALDGGR